MTDFTSDENNRRIVLQIAKTCHSVNKAWCEHNGDMSQLDWAECADWQKKSAIQGVVFNLSNPDATPEDTHNSWLDAKIKDGWVYGEVKDVELKTHPSLLPYNELDDVEKVKDKLFQAIVSSFTV